ncbi:MAG: hypothetical protein QXS93_02020 [Candidatus Micrarchaeia archaeon]
MTIPFIRERPAAIMLLLRNTTKTWCVSSLSREAGLTYLHTLHLLSQMYNLGLVDYKKEGRRKVVFLTEKGKSISSTLNQLIDDLKEQ